jgi:hypothetical protein
LVGKKLFPRRKFHNVKTNFSVTHPTNYFTLILLILPLPLKDFSPEPFNNATKEKTRSNGEHSGLASNKTFFGSQNDDPHLYRG